MFGLAKFRISDKVIQTIWESRPGIEGAIKTAFRIFGSFFVALVIYNLSMTLVRHWVQEAVPIYLNELATANQKIAEITGADTSLAGVKICLFKPKLDLTHLGEDSKFTSSQAGQICKPTMILKEIERDSWLSFAIQSADDTNAKEIVIVRNASVLGISQPRIIHSIHSLSRLVETYFQYPKPIAGTVEVAQELRLCAGSRKLLDSSKCKNISEAIEGLTKQLKNDLGWIRIVCLVSGLVQFATLVVFVHVLLETLGLRLTLFKSKVQLFTSITSAGVDRAVTETPELAWRVKTGDEFAKGLKEYSKQIFHHPWDKLLLRVVRANRVFSLQPSLPAGKQQNEYSTIPEAYRDYLSEEPAARFSGLDIANEAMLKLAFIGTIWGIGEALFLVRDLDSMDPVQRILTKSEMFAGIGTGFGATLIGVLFSILASVRVHSIAARWDETVNDGFDIVVKQDMNDIIADADYVPATEAIKQHAEPLTTIQILGLTMIMLIALAVFAFLFSDASIIETISHFRKTLFGD